MFQPGLFKGKRILVNGSGFTRMLDCSDAEWEQARALIKAQNEKDKARRSV